ncbi:hypothetical protein G210_2132 [Candida maltosa Xu316]|uniref:Uncharacterized protein n=1 Tax=Candida maltosa (strain Xu316) TaxID=1245528 RepID=M3JX60_CANMX|nr:hypothetical protein G210_2132 [Candida maltosa Xu316]
MGRAPVFKHKYGPPLPDYYYYPEYNRFYKIIIYEEEDEIRDCLNREYQCVYIIQTYRGVLRLQYDEPPYYNFNQHEIMDRSKDNLEYISFLQAKSGDLWERINRHMEQTDHSKCEIN